MKLLVYIFSIHRISSQFLGCEYNVAFGQTTWQSSDYLNYVSDFAVNGNTYAYMPASSPGTNCAHTYEETNPNWYVDWGSVYTIHRVRLYNRLDCCSDRLSNFDVYFYNASGSIVYTHNQITQVGENIDITVPNISANKMKVYLLGSNLRILTLCEVEVYTYDIDCPSSLPSAYPSIYPSYKPSLFPSYIPSARPSKRSSIFPSSAPSVLPTYMLSMKPSLYPSILPTDVPSFVPSNNPTENFSSRPSFLPKADPSFHPNASSFVPSNIPTENFSSRPSFLPKADPSFHPTRKPSYLPSLLPSQVPSKIPSEALSKLPSFYPSVEHSLKPTIVPSVFLTSTPSFSVTTLPTNDPSEIFSFFPSQIHTKTSTYVPTVTPSITPTITPSATPSTAPSNEPSISQPRIPSFEPTNLQTSTPSEESIIFTPLPTMEQFYYPTKTVTTRPSDTFTRAISLSPSQYQTEDIDGIQSKYPSTIITFQPSLKTSQISSSFNDSYPSNIIISPSNFISPSSHYGSGQLPVVSSVPFNDQHATSIPTNVQTTQFYVVVEESSLLRKQRVSDFNQMSASLMKYLNDKFVEQEIGYITSVTFDKWQNRRHLARKNTRFRYLQNSSENIYFVLVTGSINGNNNLLDMITAVILKDPSGLTAYMNKSVPWTISSFRMLEQGNTSSPSHLPTHIFIPKSILSAIMAATAAASSAAASSASASSATVSNTSASADIPTKRQDLLPKTVCVSDDLSIIYEIENDENSSTYVEQRGGTRNDSENAVTSEDTQITNFKSYIQGQEDKTTHGSISASDGVSSCTSKITTCWDIRSEDTFNVFEGEAEFDDDEEEDQGVFINHDKYRSVNASMSESFVNSSFVRSDNYQSENMHAFDIENYVEDVVKNGNVNVLSLPKFLSSPSKIVSGSVGFDGPRETEEIVNDEVNEREDEQENEIDEGVEEEVLEVEAEIEVEDNVDDDTKSYLLDRILSDKAFLKLKVIIGVVTASIKLDRKRRWKGLTSATKDQ